MSALHPYYLHADGSLNEQMPGDEASSQYQFDPHHPVPRLAGRLIPAKISVQTALAIRSAI